MKQAKARSRRELHARALSGRAETLDLVGRHSDSILDYTFIMNNAREVQERIAAQVGLYRIYNKMGEIAKAKNLGMRALKDARKQQHDELIGVSLTSVAFSLINRGEFNKALKKAKEALAYLQKATKKQGLSIEEKKRIKGHLADGFNSMGHIRNQQGKYKESLLSFRKGLKLAEQAGNQIGIITFLNNIGWDYKLLNDHKHAISFFNRAMEISQKIGCKNAIATIVGNLGLIYHEMAEYDEALNHFREALDINREMGSKSGIAMNMNNMANVYLDQKEIDRAKNLFLKSLAIFERIGYHFGTAMALSNLGIIYFGMGKFEKALEFVKRSEKLVNESGVVEVGMRNMILKGRILRETGALQESMDILQSVIKDTEHFGVKDIFIHAVIAYIETVCAGTTTFSKKLYLSKAEPALLLKRAEAIAEELGLKHIRGDIATVKKKWEEVQN